MTAIRTELRALLALAWPLYVAQLASFGAAFIDVIVTGRATAADLAGLAIGDAVFLIISFTLMGTMMFVNIRLPALLARARGEVQGFMRQSLFAALLVGGVAGLISVLMSLVVGRIDMDPAVRDIAAHFLLLIAPAYPAIALFRALQGYMTGLGETRPTLVLTVLGLVLQLGLNAVFVFGLFGLPALGGVGPALSSLIGWWAKTAALAFWVRRRPHYADTQPFSRSESPDLAMLRGFLALGMPVGVSFLVEGSLFALIPFLVAPLGAVDLAAHQIAFNLSAFLILLPASIGYGLTTRVGLALGEGNRAEATFRARVGLGLSTLLALLVVVLMLGFGPALAHVYTTNPAIAGLAGTLLVILGLYHLAESLQTVASAIIRAYAEVKAIMVIQLVANWGVALPLGVALGLGPVVVPGMPATAAGVTGLWIGLAVGLGAAATGMLVLLRRTMAAHLP